MALVAAVAAQDATTSISGRIVSAATGLPVPGAQVYALPEDSDDGRLAKADADGRFELKVPAPARYRVSASAPGYPGRGFGDEPEIGPTLIAVRAGQPLHDIEIQLHRGSTIAGVVTDEFKDPVVGATVRALTRRGVDGEFRLVPAGTARTDDRGSYRLIGLAAGVYLVAASDGLSVTLAPAAVTASAARRIAIGMDTEQEGVNIQTRSAATGSIEGLVVGFSAGAPGLTINLVRDPDTALGLWPAAAVRLQPGGRLTMTDVPAGSYVLIVRPGSGANAPRAWAREPVIVTAKSTAHVAVTMRQGARISGRVTAPGPVRGRIQIDPIGSDHPEAAAAQATLTTDGSFVMSNVAPGRYRWTPAQPLTQSGRLLLSVLIKDEDITDAPFEVAPDTAIENVRVTLTEGARLAGTVLDARERPTTAGAVVVAAADSRYWSPASRRVRVARPDTDGRFDLRLPPGRYHVMHVDTLTSGQLWDPSFLRTLAGARTVTLADGQVATVQLRLK